jgi:hypothetical protein
MRRRARRVDPAHQPPARLLTYNPADWLPLVDTSEYDPDHYRNIRDHVPYGEPWFSFENWHADEAWHLWTKARHDWCEEHGWPGGLDIINLFQQEARMTFAGNRRRGQAGGVA